MNEVDAYIQAAPEAVQDRLRAMRAAIQEAAPEATEKISWGMPTYMQEGAVVHFAAQKHHIGFYPGPSGVAYFMERMPELRGSKGAVQLPNAQPLPLELVGEVTAMRVEENKREAEEKRRKKQEAAAAKKHRPE